MPPEVKPFLGFNVKDPLCRLAIEATGGKELFHKVVYWKSIELSRGIVSGAYVPKSTAPLHHHLDQTRIGVQALRRLWKAFGVEGDAILARAKHVKRCAKPVTTAWHTPAAIKAAINGVSAGQRHVPQADPAMEASRRQLFALAQYGFVRASARTFGLEDNHAKLTTVLTLPEGLSEPGHGRYWGLSETAGWGAVFYRSVLARLNLYANTSKFRPTYLPSGFYYANDSVDKDNKNHVSGGGVAQVFVCSWLVNDTRGRQVHVMDEFAYDWVRRMAWRLRGKDTLDHSNAAEWPVTKTGSICNAHWLRINFEELPAYMFNGWALAHCQNEAALKRQEVAFEEIVEESAQPPDAWEGGMFQGLEIP